MNRPSQRFARLAAVTIAACLALPSHALQRAFVASNGDDANAATSCVLTLPCRTFAAAIGVVDAGGEILAMDGGNFGPVSIAKSVSIIGNAGFHASVSISSGTAISIASPGVAVVLRNIAIESNGGNGLGIEMTDGASLAIEDCLVSGFSSDAGAWIGAPASLRVTGTTFRGNGAGLTVAMGAIADIADSAFLGNIYGLLLQTGNPRATVAAVSGSFFTGNDYGISAVAYGRTARAFVTATTVANSAQAAIFARSATADAVVTVTVGDSMVWGNAEGFHQEATAGTTTFESLGNNALRGNGTDHVGTILPAPKS